MTTSNRIRTSTLLLGAMLAVVAPAMAMPVRDASPPSDAADRIVLTGASGFAWADAAVGAGLALAVVALALAMLTLRRRSAAGHIGVRGAR
jgi:hypothetical protein